MKSRYVVSVLVLASLMLGGNAQASTIKNYDSKYDILLKNKAELTKEETNLASKMLDNITMEEMAVVVEEKVERQINKVTNKKVNRFDREYERTYLKSNVELYRKAVEKVGKTKKFKEVNSDEFEKTMKESLLKDKKLSEIISFTGEKLGENTLLGSYSPKNKLLSFLRIESANAAGGNCDYDNRWPNWATAKWQSGSYHTATGIDRVKNDPNEYPCDYRVHFNARSWKTADGYDWIDYQMMVNWHGGVNYSQSGDRVIVGHGSAVAAGNFNSWAVRHGIIMRTW